MGKRGEGEAVSFGVTNTLALLAMTECSDWLSHFQLSPFALFHFPFAWKYRRVKKANPALQTLNPFVFSRAALPQSGQPLFTRLNIPSYHITEICQYVIYTRLAVMAENGKNVAYPKSEPVSEPVG